MWPQPWEQASEALRKGVKGKFAWSHVPVLRAATKSSASDVDAVPQVSREEALAEAAERLQKQIWPVAAC
jgi:hypothetical protein